MLHMGEHTAMEKILATISFLYTGFAAIFTTTNEIEIFARIFMYVSAGILSLVSAYYWIRNKGRKK